MSVEILARNILVLDQVEEIATAFSTESIYFVLLKGIALVNLLPEYLSYRVMEDIDILVRPEQLEKAKETLYSLRYKKSDYDPYAFRRESSPAYVDLCDGLWYLNKKENLELFFNAISIPIIDSRVFVKVLSPEDCYINLLAHSIIHHTKMELRWFNDLKLLEDKFNDKLNRGKIKFKCKNYGIPLNSSLNTKHKFLGTFAILQKGHIQRFIFLPLLRKAVYLFNTLFPSTKFLVDRYDLISLRQIVFWRIYRPVDLIIKCF